MTHRLFLSWLLYIVVVIFGFGVLLHLGLPQIAIQYDRSHLTYLLFACYLLAEGLSAREVWNLSEQNRIADAAAAWLAKNRCIGVQPNPDGSTVLTAESPIAGPATFESIPASVIAEHFNLLANKANGSRIEQDTLIDITAERLYERASIAEFISQRIVWIGILATILGVIMAFWPMIGGASIDQMRSNISEFFGGVAVAFIPTAVSFMLKIVLDVHSFIVSYGARRLIDTLACMSESSVIPALHKRSAG